MSLEEFLFSAYDALESRAGALLVLAATLPAALGLSAALLRSPARRRLGRLVANVDLGLGTGTFALAAAAVVLAFRAYDATIAGANIARLAAPTTRGCSCSGGMRTRTSWTSARRRRG